MLIVGADSTFTWTKHEEQRKEGRAHEGRYTMLRAGYYPVQIQETQ